MEHVPHTIVVKCAMVWVAMAASSPVIVFFVLRCALSLITGSPESDVVFIHILETSAFKRIQLHAYNWVVTT